MLFQMNIGLLLGLMSGICLGAKESTAHDLSEEFTRKYLIEKLSLHLVKDIHNPILGNFNGNASRLNMSWVDNAALVTSEGHKWCRLQRDNWSCKGPQYQNMLKAHQPYNSNHSVQSLPRGSRVFFEGNSFLMEQNSAAVCNAPDVGRMLVYRSYSTNDMLLCDRPRNISWLVIDNDIDLFKNRSVEDSVLKHFHANVVVLGSINSGLAPSDEERRQEFRAVFDTNPKFITWQHMLPADCVSPNCQKHGGHQCFPGPMSRVSEQLVKEVGIACREHLQS